MVSGYKMSKLECIPGYILA